MNSYNDYGFNESTACKSIGQQLCEGIDDLKVDVTDTMTTQIETIQKQTEAINTQTTTQTKDAEAMRTNQTSIFGNLIKTIKSIFTGTNEQGDEENFYEMIARENNETQAYLDTQNKTTDTRLQGIISSLNDIAKDIESNTSGDKTNADAIKTAINNLKLIINP